MKDRKRLVLCLISLAVLCVGFVIIRYTLFSAHGMKEWPLVLFIAGLLVIGTSYFMGARQVPAFAALSYIIGYAIGAIFQTNGFDPGGGRTNNLWVIWTVVFVCFTLASILTELLAARKKKQE